MDTVTVLFAVAIGVVAVISTILAFRSWRRGEGFKSKTETVGTLPLGDGGDGEGDGGR